MALSTDIRGEEAGNLHGPYATFYWARTKVLRAESL